MKPKSQTARQRIAAAIKAQGITPTDAARKAGVDPSILSRFLRGERDVINSTYERIVKALGI